MDKKFEIRDKYLTTVIRDPRQEQRVLEFIIATADDLKIQAWADGQLKQAKQKVAILEDRKRLYLETIKVVSDLADAQISNEEWVNAQYRFWKLYKTELLPVESLEVEKLMVGIGRLLENCNSPNA